MLRQVLVICHVLVFCAAFKIQGRITEGGDARAHEAPYIVSIQMQQRGTKYGHSCGGTIINKNWILTAAHCLENPTFIPKLRIEAGRYNVTNLSEVTAQSRTIDYYKLHSQYVGGPVPYDIALIYVKEPFNWTKEVQPVNLPEPFSTPTGPAFLYGWGVISKNWDGIRPDLLQTATLPIISNDECLKAFRGLIHPSNICTATIGDGVASCSSDSGGPLVQRGHLQRDTLIGVVSWGAVPCGKVGKPSIFVKVSHFIDWMDLAMKSYENTLNF